jgi:hypothetical protein
LFCLDFFEDAGIMTELNSAALLNKVSPALPVRWYFDPKIHELEMELLFKGGANYVGHG